MEFATLVTLWSTQMILSLPGTELSEILSGLWDYISEEFEFDTAQWFTCYLLVYNHISIIIEQAEHGGARLVFDFSAVVCHRLYRGT
jgi:hypothetical protein